MPYTAETPIAVVFKHIQDPLPSARQLNASLPESVELVLLKALAKNPEDRYQKAEDFVQAIQKAIPEGVSADVILSQESVRDVMNTEPTNSASGPKITERQSGPGLQTAPSQAPIEARAAIKGSPASNHFLIWAAAGIGILVLVGAIAAIGIRMLSTNDTPEDTPESNTAAPVIHTSIPSISPVPFPSPTALPPTEITLGGTFRDDFDGQLAEGWTWLAEDPAKWSLTAVAGSLQILASDSSLDGPALPYNILVRDAPTGDFEISTSLQFAPASNYQVAGLIVFQDQSNALQFGRAFCDVPGACVGDGIYFDNFENGSVTGSNYRTAYRGEVLYLRLQRTGNAYSGYFSENGEQWTKIGEHVRDFSQARVGLIAAQAPTPIPALFDYFTVNALSPN